MVKWVNYLYTASLNWILWLTQSFATSLSFTLPYIGLTTIVVFVVSCINYPNNAGNVFLIWLFEQWVQPVLIQTPDNYKLGFLLTSFASQIPAGLSGFVFEIFSGAAGILGIYLSFRLLRFLPFIK